MPRARGRRKRAARSLKERGGAGSEMYGLVCKVPQLELPVLPQLQGDVQLFDWSSMCCALPALIGRGAAPLASGPAARLQFVCGGHAAGYFHCSTDCCLPARPARRAMALLTMHVYAGMA